MSKKKYEWKGQDMVIDMVCFNDDGSLDVRFTETSEEFKILIWKAMGERITEIKLRTEVDRDLPSV